jgi:hypothetical protein
MTVCAEPMPVYVPCCAASGPAPRHYAVQMKLNRAGGAAGRVEENAYHCMTAEGAPVQVVVYGAPDHPDQGAGCLCVCVMPAGQHKVGLEMHFETGRAYRCGKDGERMQCDCARVCRTVAAGKPTHVTLLKGPAGAEVAWAEVTVTEAPHAAPERIAKAPRPTPLDGPGCVAGVTLQKEHAKLDARSVGAAVVGAAAAVGEMCGGMTLPSGQYVNHPPQYFPPSPAFPLPREMAAQQAVPMPPPVVAPPWPAVMMPPPMPVPVMAVPVPAPTQPAGGAGARAVRADGKAWLEVCGDGTPFSHCKSMALETSHGETLKLTAAKGRVVLRGAEMTAWADGVHTDGPHGIVLFGHVRLVSHRDGHEDRITADMVEVNLEGEHVEVRVPDLE